MTRNIPQLLIAAPTSGAGKTTITRGLMAALTRRGMEVHPYKCGPDYIDTKFHAAVCGCPSINLDLFMASEQHVKELYARYSCGADACVVEGMMGFFDGYCRDEGSSYTIARTLNLPVILVVDAKSAAYSMAALLQGFVSFRKDVCIVGVIFNRVGSTSHFNRLRSVCEELRLPCLGYLPKHAALEQPSRYLGLDFSREDTSLQLLVDEMEQFVHIDRIMELTSRPLPIFSSSKKTIDTSMHITIARNDESFSFLYQEHLDLLKGMGRVTFIDPEKNEDLPPETDLLYLIGGYPEKHLPALSAARKTSSDIRSYAQKGGKILAECGGMMYLCHSIATDDGVFPMAGVFPYEITARTEDRKLSLGYRKTTYRGQELRGHEFHYSHFTKMEPPSVAQFYDASDISIKTPFLREGNVLASYIHLYWGECDIKELFTE